MAVRRQPPPCLAWALIGALAFGGWLPLAARGQSLDETASTARAERLRQMQQRFSGMKAVRKEPAETPIEPMSEPLLRFNDPSRGFFDGAIWAWGRTGRPAALLAIEWHGQRWSYELISLSTAPVSVVLTADDWQWSPAEPGLKFQTIADAPPDDTAQERSRQLRTLARRFSAWEFIRDQRYELRLMPQPIHRYSDASANTEAGALFVFANGTNPEAILVLECRGDAAGQSWRYAWAPLTTARVSASLDGDEVWSKPPSSVPQAQLPYAYFDPSK
jgi:hypothetical protein